MSGLHPLVGRRHLLASTMIGTIGALLPAAPAHASASLAPDAATLEPASTSADQGMNPSGDRRVAATAASPSPADTSIRPFHYHASEEDLADLKRRIRATRWPRPIVAVRREGRTMRLSTKGRYAVMAMVDLARHSNGDPVSLSYGGKRPFAFTGKIGKVVFELAPQRAPR